MRNRLTDVFSAFGRFAEDASLDGARIENLQQRNVSLERENDRLRQELADARQARDEAQKGRNDVLTDGPREAADALAEELGKENCGRLDALRHWPRLTPEERTEMKKTLATVIDEARIPF